MKQTKKIRPARTAIYCVLAAACVVLAAVLYTQGPALGKLTSLAFAGAVGACLLACLYFVLQKIEWNVTGNRSTMNIAFTGMLAALVLVGFFLTIRLPGSMKAQVGFGNVFCIFAGLMMGPVYGGLAAGIGGGLYDLVSGWADTSILTFVTKFIMAFVCGAIAWGVQGKLLCTEGRRHLPRVIVAAIAGSLTYSVLYLLNGLIEGILMGNAPGALEMLMLERLIVTVVNAAIADAVAIPLFFVIRAALKRNHLAFCR